MATEYCFTVNGMRRTTTEKKSLLRYLRDDLHLFSVKDGCSEGACGTCTIIVDGVAVKACVLTTDKSVGRNIVTVEGLTEREQDAFVYAFGSKGSVQVSAFREWLWQEKHLLIRIQTQQKKKLNTH